MVLFYWTAAPNPWRSIDYTVYQDKKCRKHHVAMEKIKIKIRYGGEGSPAGFLVCDYKPHLRFTASFEETRQTEFPNARTVLLGGDLISDRSPESAYIYVCPQCIELFEKWKKETNQKRD